MLHYVVSFRITPMVLQTLQKKKKKIRSDEKVAFLMKTQHRQKKKKSFAIFYAKQSRVSLNVSRIPIFGHPKKRKCYGSIEANHTFYRLLLRFILSTIIILLKFINKFGQKTRRGTNTTQNRTTSTERTNSFVLLLRRIFDTVHSHSSMCLCIQAYTH